VFPVPWSRDARPVREAATLTGVLLLAFVIGYWNQSHAHYAQALALLPILVALACKPQVPLAIGVAALPLQLDVFSGVINLTLSDLLMTFAFAAALPPLLLVNDWRGRIRQVTPLLVAAAPFTAWLIAVALHHGSLVNVAKTGQYYQLFLLPLLLGAVVLERGTARIAMTAFVAAGIVIAVLWATTAGDFPFAGNKNPSGQFIADAAILALALAPSWLWRLAALVPLLVGLGFTQSRGAFLAAGVGIIVLLALRGLGTWRKTVAALVPLIAAVAVVYQALPPEIQKRATTFSSGDANTSLSSLSSDEYSIRLREIYRENGWELVNDHPVFGVGPGNYATGTPGTVEYNTDPHDLVIRTAGDTGYPGLIGFGILVAGSTGLALRRRRVNPYAAVAVAMQAALIAHGFVDVYWVRGTPVLGWLLIGMALNRRLDEPSERPSRHRGGLSPRRLARSLPVLAPPQHSRVGDRQLQ
jgi:hypothetical protein